MKRLNYFASPQLIYILFICLLSNCIRPVKDKDLPKVQAKLVIGGFISPQDSLVTVKVGKSTPVGANIDPGSSLTTTVVNAIVLLSGGGASAILTYNEELETYYVPASEFPIIPGQTYTLVVSTPDGLIAKSTTTVPVYYPPFTWTVDSAAIIPPYSNEKRINIHISWEDPASHQNYYRLYGEIDHGQSINNGGHYLSSIPIYFNSSPMIISDEGLNGGSFGPYIGHGIYFPDRTTGRKEIKVFLLNTDVNYFNFYNSVTTYNNSNPFQEPFNLFTNIEGGMGVFASFQASSIQFDIE